MPAEVSLRLVGDWARARQILDVAQRDFRDAMQRSVQQEGRFFERQIVQGIRRQAPAGKKFKPLSPLTLAMRRDRGQPSTKALIVNSDLQNSVKTTKRGPTVFVGVHRSAQGRDGRELVQLAAVHEFGSRPIVIQVTPRMRRFFFAFLARQGVTPDPGKSSGGFRRGILVIKIPARPFIRPVFERYGKPDMIRKRVLGRVAKRFGGDLGDLM